MDDKPITHKNNGNEDQPVERHTQRYASKPLSQEEVKERLSKLKDQDGNPLDISKWKGLKYITTQSEIDVIEKALKNEPVEFEKAYNLPMMKNTEDKQSKKKIIYSGSQYFSTLVRDQFKEELKKQCEEKGITPKKDREMIIFIGYPAAGKSSILGDYVNPEKGFIEMDNDIAKGVSALAPWYDNGLGAGNVAPIGADAAFGALEDFCAEGYNMVVPYVGKSKKSVELAADVAKRNGYTVKVIHKKQEPSICVARLVKRFAETGRFVGLSYFRTCMKQCPKTWNELWEEYQEKGTIGGVEIDGYEHA